VVFASRRVYLAVTVTIISMLRHGAGGRRLQDFQELVGEPISWHTLRRWQDWWRKALPASSLWQQSRGLLRTQPDPDQLPGSLLEIFCGHGPPGGSGLINFLKFTAIMHDP